VLVPDLVVRSRRVVLPRGTRPAAIHIRGGRVIGILDFDDVAVGCAVDDVNGVVLPGLVDTRVDVRARASGDANAFDATTRAAAAGGITTIVLTPYGDGPPITNVQALEDRRREACGACWVDVGFWAGAIAGNTRELSPLFEAGVLGFACVLGPCRDSDVPVSEADLRTVMPGLRNIGATLLVQAGLESVGNKGCDDHRPRRWFDAAPWTRRRQGRSASYASYLESRPKAEENAGIARVAELCRQYRTRTHVVHLSSSDALTPLFHARTAKVPISADTCPHYLNLVAEELTGDAATLLATAPPIRGRENREFLWAALAHGLIQMTVADRFTPLELGLSLMWTGAHGRGYPLEQIAEWMSAAPARLAGLTRKGRIDVGYDADLVVFQPDDELPADSAALRQHCVYRGLRLRGVVERTYLRGARVYSRHEGWAPSPPGTFVSRQTVTAA
jgi:allantoinase